MYCNRLPDVHSRWWIAVFSLLFFSHLTACSSSRIDYAADQPLKADEGVVFGKFRVSENGKSKSLSSVFGERKLGVTLVPENSAKAVYTTIDNEGFFAWRFSGGEYTLASFDWQRYGITQGRIFADFRVVPGKAVYIGDIAIDFFGARYLVRIEDNAAESVAVFRSRFTGIVPDSFPELIKLEKRR